MNENYERGILYMCAINAVDDYDLIAHFQMNDWDEPDNPNLYFSPSESFTSYNFWLGRDSDVTFEED